MSATKGDGGGKGRKAAPVRFVPGKKLDASQIRDRRKPNLPPKPTPGPRPK